jgi:hypothetical protein
VDASYDRLIHLLIAGVRTPDGRPHLITRAPSKGRLGADLDREMVGELEALAAARRGDVRS